MNMEIKDILAAQQAWLTTLQTELPKPSAATVNTALGSAQAQIGAIQSRIDELTKRKTAVMGQFDAAIARQQNALAALSGGPAARAADLLRGLPPLK
jgi:hypothetical protein